VRVRRLEELRVRVRVRLTVRVRVRARATRLEERLGLVEGGGV